MYFTADVLLFMIKWMQNIMFRQRYNRRNTMSSCDSCKSKDQCGSASSGSCPGEGEQSPESFREKLHAESSIGIVIGLCSGKGGVGKSLVTSVLAAKLAREGYRVGILDADVTGPSIPKAFGLSGQLSGSSAGIMPVITHSGIQVVSVNLLLENEEQPVIWRGPVIAGVVKQFWTDVIWKELDVLLIDMPPGTGDVPLTVFQAIPLDGVILVSTPQDLVSMVVNKARNMALMMKVRILGFVENMSYITCTHCGEQLPIFGTGGVDKAAAELNVPVFDKVAVDPFVTALVDAGEIEKIHTDMLDGTVRFVAGLIDKKRANL